MKRLLLMAIVTLGAGVRAPGAASAKPSEEPLRLSVKRGRSDTATSYAMATLGDDLIMFGGGQHAGLTWRWDGNDWLPLAPPVSPPARTGHAMVTLGNKIFLFGGVGPDGESGASLADAWQFDGTTWSQVYSPGPSPPPRSRHAMAVLNGKVLMFGGESSAPRFDDTWIWDGATWSPVVTDPATTPPGRRGHSMATLNGQIVMFGGELYDSPQGDTWTWNGTTWTRIFPAASPSERANQTMVTLGNRIVLFGGLGIVHEGFDVNSLRELDDTWEWDGTTWNERFPTTVPFTGDRKVMAARGGELVLYVPTALAECPGDSWGWDGTTWKRHPGPSSPPLAVSGYVTAALNGKPLLFGRSCSGNREDIWSWTDGGWTTLNPPSAPTPRERPAVATVGGKVVMFGGGDATTFNEAQPVVVGDMWQWDGTTWTETHPLVGPAWRRDAAMAAIGDVAILFGGSTDFEILGDTWRWDGTTWTQLSPENSPPARTSHAMAALGDKIFLHGGRNLAGVPLGDTWMWDGTTWTELSPILAPSARQGHALVASGDRLILFGGSGLYFAATTTETRELDDLWEWNGSAWTELAAAQRSDAGDKARPIGRHNASLVAVGDKLLLHGGSRLDPRLGGIEFNDTWIFDAGAWTEHGTAMGTPPSRTGHAMAAATDGILMFGGGDEGATFAFDDTWVWDGANWSERKLLLAPPARMEHAMAALGGQIVLFGGHDLVSTVFDDTWLWNGKTWTQATVSAAPTARMGHAMAALGGDVILFGGTDGSRVTNDTWAWNGKAWRRLTPPTSPPPRVDHAMASAGGEIILFGGTDLMGTMFDDVWSWDGTTWTEQTGPAPPAVAGHAMAGFGDSILLFGGGLAEGSTGDTWLWKEARWKRLRMPLTPPPSVGPAIAAGYGRLVLFPGDHNGDTWFAAYDDPPASTGDGGCACAVGRDGHPSSTVPGLMAIAIFFAACRRRRR